MKLKSFLIAIILFTVPMLATSQNLEFRLSHSYEEDALTNVRAEVNYFFYPKWSIGAYIGGHYDKKNIMELPTEETSHEVSRPGIMSGVQAFYYLADKNKFAWWLGARTGFGCLWQLRKSPLDNLKPILRVEALGVSGISYKLSHSWSIYLEGGMGLYTPTEGFPFVNLRWGVSFKL